MPAEAFFQTATMNAQDAVIQALRQAEQQADALLQADSTIVMELLERIAAKAGIGAYDVTVDNGDAGKDRMRRVRGRAAEITEVFQHRNRGAKVSLENAEAVERMLKVTGARVREVRAEATAAAADWERKAALCKQYGIPWPGQR